MKFQNGEALDADGVLTAALGFEYDGVFIVNPYQSDCGRFDVDPAFYGLSTFEAEYLRDSNILRNLMAYQ